MFVNDRTPGPSPLTRRGRHGVLAIVALISLAAAPAAHAQWAVIDVGAIAQLVQQVTTLRQQLQTAQDHLTQARQEFSSITGDRGMEQLLQDTVRNYLPADWAQLNATLQLAADSYQALSGNVQQAISANAILAPQQLAGLSAATRAQLEQNRQSAALLQATSHAALANTSSRFASIQQLIDAIPRASDQKGILDLQARIQSEQGMLANEQTKLQVLYQAAQADELSRKQRSREQAIAAIGSYRDLPPMNLPTPSY